METGVKERDGKRAALEEEDEEDEDDEEEALELDDEEEDDDEGWQDSVGPGWPAGGGKG